MTVTLPTTMTASVLARYGTPEEALETTAAALPAQGPYDVLVRVEAAGLNPVDVRTRSGGGIAGMLGDPPYVLGWDVAGTVAAGAPNAHRFAPGDRVAGFIRFPAPGGGFAELASAPTEELALVPDGVDAVTAAALPLAGLTAHQALTEAGGLRPGDRVAVLGGGGGVGHLAVQLASLAGARVTATASAGKLDLLRELGAADAQDRRARPVADAVRDADLVLDTAGGTALARALAAAPAGSRVLTLPGPPADELVALAAERDVVLRAPMVRPSGEQLADLLALVAEGRLRVVVSREFDGLGALPKAHEALEAGHATGKLVVRV